MNRNKLVRVTQQFLQEQKILGPHFVPVSGTKQQTWVGTIAIDRPMEPYGPQLDPIQVTSVGVTNEPKIQRMIEKKLKWVAANIAAGKTDAMLRAGDIIENPHKDKRGHRYEFFDYIMRGGA